MRITLDGVKQDPSAFVTMVEAFLLITLVAIIIVGFSL